MRLIIWFLKLFPINALSKALANKKGIVSVSMVTEHDLLEMAKLMSQRAVLLESIEGNFPQPDLRPSDGPKFH